MDRNVVIAIIVIILVIWLLRPYFERFDDISSVSLPVGSPLYGLRGEPLRYRSITDNYISPRRQVRLSQSNGDMWDSDFTPAQEGIEGCYNVPCPNVGYDAQDTCWKCNTPEFKMTIPDVWPHVGN